MIKSANIKKKKKNHIKNIKNLLMKDSIKVYY